MHYSGFAGALRVISCRAPIKRGSEPTIVRKAVCHNINASISTLEKLASDLDLEVRNAVAQHPKTTAETLVALGRDADPQVLLSVVHQPANNHSMIGFERLAIYCLPCLFE